MKLITVYKNPSDYPGMFVAREFDISSGVPVPAPEPLLVEDSYVSILGKLPLGLTRFSRDPNDDHAIVEVWL